MIIIRILLAAQETCPSPERVACHQGEDSMGEDSLGVVGQPRHPPGPCIGPRLVCPTEGALVMKRPALSHQTQPRVPTKHLRCGYCEPGTKFLFPFILITFIDI